MSASRRLGAISVLSRLILGGIFIAASFSKIIDPWHFFSTVESYRILPSAAVPLVTLALPWWELITGVLLIFGLVVPAAALLAAVLLVSFICGLSVNLLRGVEMSCGCFGWLEGGEKISVWTVFRDALFLVPALQLLGCYRPCCGLDVLVAKRWRRAPASEPDTQTDDQHE